MLYDGMDVGVPHALRDLLSRFQYRPGWRFYIDERGCLCVEAQVIDTDDTSRTCPLHFRRIPPPLMRDDFGWSRWLLSVIMEIERHEAREFFKVDGVKIFDPHKEDA